MVGMTATVVAERGTNAIRCLVDLAQQLFERQLGKLAVVLEGLVEVRDVGLVVLAVVDAHRGGIDMRLQSCGVVRQRWEGEGPIRRRLGKGRAQSAGGCGGHQGNGAHGAKEAAAVRDQHRRSP
jgi:hypothetical protein